MGLIFLFTLPILAAWQGSEPIGTVDYLIGGFMFILIVIQYISINNSMISRQKNIEELKIMKNLMVTIKRFCYYWFMVFF